MDLDRLTTGERLIGGGSIVLFIASFLAWFNIEADGISYGTTTGWDAGFLWGPVPTFIGLLMLAHVAVSNFAPDVDLPDLPWTRVHLVGGVLAGGLVVLKLLVGHDDFLGVAAKRGIGLFLAALAGLALAAGGYLFFREREGAAGASE